MATKIKGITVILLNKAKTGVDGFNRPVYSETEESIENVLVAPVSSSGSVDELDLAGKLTTYTMAIPKGDTHIWTNRRVQFFGHTWQTVGEPTQGIDECIPLDWNKKVTVECIE